MFAPKNQLELLSPAKDTEIARVAILHGADAVYIGGPEFGARHNAGNSIADIAELTRFAHHYYAKVYVTLNTILHDDELEAARKIIYQLYDAGVDALIVQDMGIMQMDIPPIDLHASTQADIRSVEKAKFLSDVGFSQLVLARELNLRQIKKISQTIDANIEFFVHGALCVAFSGQCYISHAQTGRSANRGDCSQACRLPYTLTDKEGAVIADDKHLLSMKDNNQAANLTALIDAGVRSFKIEGRYKDSAYVKNITAFYRQRLDDILTERSDLQPSSSGRTECFFTPDPDRTFHRSHTDYFVNGRKEDIGAFESPKYIGLPIGQLLACSRDSLLIESQVELCNGDGLNQPLDNETVGFRASKVEKLDKTRYRVFPNEMGDITKKLQIGNIVYRNYDHQWQQALSGDSSRRKIGVTLTLAASAEQLTLTATSEEGVAATVELAGHFDVAKQAEKAQATIEKALAKLGDTDYDLLHCHILADTAYFIPVSLLNQMRRDVMDKLDSVREKAYQRQERKAEVEPKPQYPLSHLSYLANVYNHLAGDFYREHGVTLIESAFEAHETRSDVPVMITKHCLRFAFNLCPKQTKFINGERNRAEPMQLMGKDEKMTLTFDCKACEMSVWGKIKPYVLKQPLLGSIVGEITLDTLKQTLPKAKKV